MIRKLINPLVRVMVKTASGRSLGRAFFRIGEWFRYEGSIIEHKKTEQNLKNEFKDLTVRNGYFKGIKYPGFVSFGSSLFPKLSGSYESELFIFFETIENRKYKTIIDIGCAEGFYAIALAVKYPYAQVEAFDIDAKARMLCKEMATFNGVADRVKIAGECTAVYIQQLNPEVKRLIICDCEGFERKLFNTDNVSSLKNADLIIELHPMFEPDVKEYLVNLFSVTHHINIVSSYDDNRKIFDLPAMYHYFTEFEKLKLVQEGRSFSMDWLTMTSKS